ncbi:small neutral amino acid transporter SnatA (MarC family) [Kineosphaera limosa]|uniref:hypothetical protein n=1 Tax=Kineosphaera limosa TaxID=111564 RepID=UPI0012FC19BE|nr:hypothetical protein [Kineosphaera limosa]NYE02516.1 small neutral amino acid transporter SnatA (MarC family) [Kineosphaera limosa]
MRAVRHAIFALVGALLLVLAMPGLLQAVSVPTVVIAVAGGVAVGVSALAARAGRTQRRTDLY